jgi:predicted nucleotidyltransferase
MSLAALGLNEHQVAIGTRVIEEESKKREHLVLYMSGAHAYGFPSPDSDLDLKCIHIAPTAKLVGFAPVNPTYDRAEIIEEVEIDYTSNELGVALSGVLGGNGNFVERVLGSSVLGGAPELESLRPLVRAVLSRRYHRHYRGFSSGQKKALAETPTVKKLLYVLRTALTGAHLLRTGELVTDLQVLAPKYGLADVSPLIERKRAGERIAAGNEVLEEWAPRVDEALAGIDRARDESPLPEDPPETAVSALEEWLVAVRRARF